VIVTPLSDRPGAVRDALLSHGWEGDFARLAAGGMAYAALHASGVTPDAIEAMLPLSIRLGLELVTGPDWLIIAGARSRLGAFARPWVQPDAVRDLATAVGMALPPEIDHVWSHARGQLTLDRPMIVGVINVTPDSFSDGGGALTIDAALCLAADLLEGGAAVCDVGGESTRPGAELLSADEERRRVIPVIKALASRHPSLPISVDTMHAATAEAALDAGAAIVNDVTAGRHEPGLVAVAARWRAGLVLSHSRGPAGRLASYDGAEYDGDVTTAVVRELSESARAATGAGVSNDAIVVDPGFGFGKTAAQSLVLLQQLDAVAALGFPVLAGVSRKRFLGEATGRPVEDRDRATAAACVLAYERGARLFRVHAPSAVRDALAVASAVAGAPAADG
jgi:dihydropteroate synthase